MCQLLTINAECVTIKSAQASPFCTLSALAVLVKSFTLSMLISSSIALSRYDEKSLSNKKPTVTEITQSLNLFGILEANDGSIWFGAFDGVHRYDGKTITDFKSKEGH